MQKGRYTLTKKSDCIRLAKGEEIDIPPRYPPAQSKNSPSDCTTIPTNSSGIHNPTIDTRTKEQQNLYHAIIVQLSQADKDFTMYSQEMLLSLPEKLTQKLVRIQPFKLFVVLL